MGKSVTAPIDQAYKRAINVCFKPFDLTKWFVLGFAAWLSQLGEGGGGGNIDIPTPGGGGWPAPAPPPAPVPPVPPMPPMPGPGGAPAPPAPFPPPTFPTPPTPQQEFAQFLAQVKQFVLNNAWWIAPAVVVAIVLIIVLMWLRARGKFMFLDGVANDRAAVVEPWKRLAPQANSYFRFSLLLGVLAIVSLVAIGGVAYLLAAADIQSQQFGPGAIAALAVGVPLLLGWMILFGVINALLDDFLVPLMYLRTSGVGPAWREFRQQIVPGNFWSIVLFYLMRIVLGIATGIIMGIGGCVLCFIAILPYLGTVLFLPIFVFTRSYSLYFLAQFGPDYNLVVERMPPMISAFPVVMPPTPGVAPPGPMPTPAAPAWPPMHEPPPPPPGQPQPPPPERPPWPPMS
jgi:hypothetical protein